MRSRKEGYSFIFSKFTLITYLGFTIAFPKETLLKLFKYKKLKDGEVILKTVLPQHPRQRLKRVILRREQEQLF